MKNIKSKLITSIAVLVGCVTLLVGTSFAWFTDSITNSGNKIQAGELKISATAYDLGTGGKSYTINGINGGKAFTFEADGQDLATVNTPIISETDWEPGRTNAKLLTVSNEDQLSAKIKLNFTTAGDLTNALWYDFVQVGESGVTGTFTQREMSTLSAFAGKMEFTLKTNDSLSFIFLYGMKTSAGNEYQGKEFTADVTILATQAAVEEDGFGNSDYDSGAEYPIVAEVSDKDALLDLLNKPGVSTNIDVTSSMTDVKNFNVTGDVIINLGKNMLSSSSTISGATLKVTEGGSLTINAEANDSGFDYTAGGLNTDGLNSKLTVNGGRYGVSGAYGAEVSATNGATVTLNSGIFSNSGAFGNAVKAGDGSVITINGGSFSVSGYESEMFYAADGGKIIIENCTISAVNGKRYAVEGTGQILVSKTFTASKPTGIADGCTVTETDSYWLITAA